MNFLAIDFVREESVYINVSLSLLLSGETSSKRLEEGEVIVLERLLEENIMAGTRVFSELVTNNDSASYCK